MSAEYFISNIISLLFPSGCRFSVSIRGHAVNSFVIRINAFAGERCYYCVEVAEGTEGCVDGRDAHTRLCSRFQGLLVVT